MRGGAARFWHEPDAPAAIADAFAPLGGEVFELPMTPERLRRLIGVTRAPAQGT